MLEPTNAHFPFHARRRRVWQSLMCFFLLLLACPVPWVSAQKSANDLMEMSLEDLMDVEVTTIGKKEQKASQMPAAVTVIAQDDIRRSGATSLAEALRMVPGMEVAQSDDATWAISIRGYNNRSADKLLVMIDGRTVYSTIYTNVFWDAQDTVLEDIERIEVIRGPGATLWGANAVHGVINIITKNAAETHGALLTTMGGNMDEAVGEVRYGAPAGNRGSYRIFAKYFRRGNLYDPDKSDGNGPFDQLRGGFRSDWKLDNLDSLTVQGDLYEGGAPQHVLRTQLTSPYMTIESADHVSAGGGNLLGRWTHHFSGGSDTALQVFYDYMRHPDLVLRQSQDIADLDFQHHVPWSARHDLLWGAGFRLNRETTHPTSDMWFTPSNQTINLFSSFIQDDIGLIVHRLVLTMGVRLEHNSFTGAEVQPTLRLLFTPDKRQAVWGAVSRAVRTPSLFETAATQNFLAMPDPSGLPALVVVRHATEAKAEELVAYELGYRVQPGQRFSLDLATFRHRYHHMEGGFAETPGVVDLPPPLHIEVPYRMGYPFYGSAHGLEMESTFVPWKCWKVRGSYTWLEAHLESSLPAAEVVNTYPVEDNPRNQFQVHSELSLPHHLEFDKHLYYTGALKDPFQRVGSYYRLDLRLGWRPTTNLELSVAGQNLLQPHHLEFPSSYDYLLGGNVKRSWYGKVTWQF